MSGMQVVVHGKPWEHSISPCTKQAIALLERNERLVTWIKPIDGTVKDQLPCIQYKHKFYTLSLRMQKAIYRHVRLRKGFSNEEEMDGVIKLRIPENLLREKIRTQSRFDVRALANVWCSYVWCSYVWCSYVWCSYVCVV